MADTNSESLVIKLFGAVTELEQSITRARTSLGQMPSISPEVLNRVSSYDGILANQRKFIHELSSVVAEGKTAETARLVNIINQLSVMIKEDVRAILLSLSNTPAPANQDDINFC
jgi:hypothetical protein